MIHSSLRVEVQGSYILVAMRGTCFRARYRKQDAPWLAIDEWVEDLDAPINSREFRDPPGSRKREGSRPRMGQEL